MKRISLILVYVMCLCVSVSYAQNENYRKLLKSYLGLNGGALTNNVDQYDKALVEVTLEVMKESQEEKIQAMPQGARKAVAEKLVSEYMKNQFREDMFNVLLPFFMENVTEQHLQVLLEKMDTERGRTSLEHINNMSLSKEKMAEMVTGMLTPMLEGKDVKPVKAVPCSESYAKNFQVYYEKSGVDAILDLLYNSLLQSVPSDTDENAKKMIQNLITAMQKNMPVILRNMMIEIATEDDLQFWVELCSMPEFEGVTGAFKQMMSDPMKLAMQIFTGYGQWLDSQTLYKL